GIRPDDALGVVILFDRGGYDAGYADAIAAHDHDLIATFLVQNLGIHGLRILGAELENMADFDTALDLQRAFAIRAGVASDDIAQILDARDRRIAYPVGAGEVEAVFVGAAHKIRQMGRSAIDDHRHVQANRPERAGIAAGSRANLFVAGEAQRFADAGHFLGFDFIQFVIAAHDQCDQ